MISLPPRLQQVHVLLEQGRGVFGIARELGISPASARRYAAEVRRRTTPAPCDGPASLPPGWERLSPREREVAAYLLAGLTDREVAERMVLSECTIHSHVRSLLHKSGLRRRVDFKRHYAPAEVFDAPRRGAQPCLPALPPALWGRLTRPQRQVVILALQSQGERQATERLGVGVKAVRQCMRRALRVLRLASVADLRRSYALPQDAAAEFAVLPPLPGEDDAPLTARQRQALSLRLGGADDAQVAACMGITPKAVHVMLRRLQQRLGVESEDDLLAFFRGEGG